MENFKKQTSSIDLGLNSGPDFDADKNWQMSDEYTELAHSYNQAIGQYHYDRALFEQGVLEDKAQRFVKEKRLPFAPRPKTPKMSKYMGKNGEWNECEDPLTFYSANDKQGNDLFYESYSMTDYHKGTHNKFTYGQMEGARKVLEPFIKKQLKEYKSMAKTSKQKFGKVISPLCIEFLSIIQKEVSGFNAEKKKEHDDMMALFEKEKKEKEAYFNRLAALTKCRYPITPSRRFLEKNKKDTEELPLPVVPEVIKKSAPSPSEIMQIASSFVPLTVQMSERVIPTTIVEKINPCIVQVASSEEVSTSASFAGPLPVVQSERLIPTTVVERINPCLVQTCESEEIPRRLPSLAADLEFPMRVTSAPPGFALKYEVKRKPFYFCSSYPQRMPPFECPLDEIEEEDENEDDDVCDDYPMPLRRRKIEKKVLSLQTMLREADPLNLTCKCSECVRIFEKRNRNVLFYTKELNLDYTTQGDTLEGTSSVSGSENITFVDERPVDMETLHRGGDISSEDVKKDLAETRWTIENVLSREFRIGTRSWNAATTYSLDHIPNFLFKNTPNSFLVSQLKLFGYLRAGMEIRIQLNGTKFHCGRLICCIVPPTWDIDWANISSVGYTNFPHAFLDASVSNSVVLQVPFTHLLTHFPLRAYSLENDSLATLGTLMIYPWNVLRMTGTASTNLYYTIYAKFINPEVHQTVYPITEFSFKDSFITQGKEGFIKGLATRGVNAGIGALDNMTGGLVTGVGDTLSNLFGFNLDKPIDPLPANPIVNRSINAPCHGAGLDHSVRLGLAPAAQTETTSDLIGGVSPDFNLLSLCQSPSRNKVQAWADSVDVGTTLFRFGVSPVYLDDYQIDKTQGNNTTYSPSMLSYVSRAFVYWRGSLKLKIQVISTQFHSGRLAIIYNPTETSLMLAPDFTDAQNLNVVVMDIEEQKEMVVDIPYMGVRPWTRCDRFRSLVNFQTTSKTPTFLGQDVNGTIRVYVLNKLVCPDNVSKTIDINFYVYAGDDFELAVPQPLDPLAPVPIANDQYGGDAEYPFRIGDKTCTIPLENRDFIVATYYETRALFIANKLNWNDVWYKCEPVGAFKCDPEVMVWWQKIQYIQRYLEKSTPQGDLMNALPHVTPFSYVTEPPKVLYTTQGQIDQTTTRDSAPAAVQILKGKQSAVIAPQTLSENAMNLQTVLKRFYPLFNTYPQYTCVGYTLYIIPVSPTHIPRMRYPITGAFAETVPVHPLAHFSRLFTYWRGSLRYKFLFSDNDSDTYVWHTPQDAQPFRIVSGMKEFDIQKRMSYAGNIAINRLQGAIEVEVPFYSPYNQCLIEISNTISDLRTCNGTLWVAMRNPPPTLNQGFVHRHTLTAFISTGEDFVLNVQKPPHNLYSPVRLMTPCTDAGVVVKDVEERVNLGNQSAMHAFPGSTGYKDIDATGQIAYCDLIPAPPHPDGNPDDWETEGLTDYLIPESVKNFLSQTQNNLNLVTDKASTTLSSIDNVATNTNALVDSLKESTDMLHTQLNSEPLQKLGKRVIASSGKVCDYVDRAMFSLSSLAVLKSFSDLMSNKSSPMRWTTFALALGALLGINYKDKISHYISQLIAQLNESIQPEVQALDPAVRDVLESNEETIATGLAVIGTLLFAYVFDALPKFTTIKEFLKQFLQDKPMETQGFNLREAHFGLLGVKALYNVFNNLLQYSKDFFNYILDRENPQVLLARQTIQYKDEVLNLIRELDELDNEANILEALKDPLAHNRFYRLMQKCLDLTETAVREKLDSRIVQLVTECRRRARVLIRRLEMESDCKGFRYDPFVVCIHGPTGTGKTKMMSEVSRVIQSVVDVPDYNLIYNRPINDKFWSGYSQQSIVHWDEFGQNTKLDEVVPEFISLRGNDPVRLNLAAVEEKGRFFTSKAIIMTTNVPYQDFNTVRDMRAFKRRRHLMIRMQHRQGGNANRVQNSPTYDPEFNHAVFRITNNLRDMEIGEDKSKADILAIVRRDCTRWHQKQLAMIDEFRTQAPPVLPRGLVAGLEPDAIPEEEEQYFELDDTDDEMTTQGKEHVVFHRTTDKLSDDEEFQVELFLATQHTLTEDQRLAYLNRPLTFKLQQSKLYKLALNTFDKISTTITDFIHEYPRLSAAIGCISALSITAMGYWLFASDGSPEATNCGDHNVVVDSSADLHKVVGNTLVEKFEYSEEAAGRYDQPQLRKPLKKVVAEGAIENRGPVQERQNRCREGGRPGRTIQFTEGCEDPCALDIIRHRIHPYVVRVAWTTSQTTQTLMRAFHLKGSLILLPYHFFIRARAGDIFSLLHRMEPVQITFDLNNLYRLQDFDWCIYDCGARLEPRKDNSKFFIKERDLAKITRTTAVLCGVDSNGVMMGWNGNATAIRDLKYTDPKSGEVYVQRGWKTTFCTEKGDCGSILVAMNTSLSGQGKVLGIHTAGREGKSEGFSVLITYEQVEALISQTKAQVIGMPIPAEVNTEEMPNIIPEGDYSIYGTVPLKLKPVQPFHTQLRVTPFKPEDKPIINNKSPAALSKFVNAEGEVVSPLKLALNKYGKLTTPFPRRNINKVISFLKDWIKICKSNSGKKVFEEKEAILGLPGLDFLDRLNMKSSPGWPYRQRNRGTLGKTSLIDEDGNVIDKELRMRLDERRDLAKKGIRVPSLWSDCLKDELRPNEKVRVGKTRLFTIAPVDFTILCRQYFLDFTAAFYDAHGTFFSAVGIDPESYEWTLLYHYLAEYGDQTIAGDFSAFDGTLQPELMDACAEIINSWYDGTEEENLVRKVLVNEMIHTMQVVDRTVYATHQGNPSGNPLTVVINSMVNVMYMMLAWLNVYPEKSCQDFVESVRIQVYGDDNLLVVKPGNELYNQQSITDVLLRHGIEYTNEAKCNGGETYRPLESVTFLKRGFRKDPEFGHFCVLPTMDLDTLYSYLHWYRKAEDVEEQLQENMRSALRFACFRGREFYDKYHGIWNACMENIEYRPLSISFDEQVDGFKATIGQLVEGNEPMETDDEAMEVEESKSWWRSLVKWGLLFGGGWAVVKAFIAGCKVEPWQRKNPVLDDRLCVCLPSGEGKSTLTKNYPELFVDVDDYILDAHCEGAFEEWLKSNPIPPAEGISLQAIVENNICHFYKWCRERIRAAEDPDDQRILLCHNDGMTDRVCIGRYILETPTGVRNNLNGRFVMYNPRVCATFAARNLAVAADLITYCSIHEVPLKDKILTFYREMLEGKVFQIATDPMRRMALRALRYPSESMDAEVLQEPMDTDISQ